MYNPLKLTNKPVSLNIDRKTEPKTDKNRDGSVAAGMTESSFPPVPKVANWYQTFVITLFIQHCQQNYVAGNLYQVVPFESFLYAVLAHEVGHVHGKKGWATFDVNPFVGMPQDSISQYIDNILEDARIEHQMMRDFPGTAGYIQLLLSSLKWKLGGQGLENSDINKDLQSLFFLTRFGIVIAGSDANLINIAWPLVISATIGDRANEIVAVQMLYYYLEDKYQNDQDYQNAKRAHLTQAPMSQSDIDQVTGAPASLIANSNKDTLQNVQDVKSGLKDAKDCLAGASGPPPSEEEKDEAFYIQTVGANYSTIMDIRNMFVRMKYKSRKRLAKEGDFSFKHQTQAYYDSVLGLEGKTNVVWRRVIPSVQLVCFWDTSSSTREIMEYYATCVVAILAALEGEDGVESALIEFNSESREIMKMGDSVKRTRIFPHAAGSTDLCPGLNIAFGGVNNEYRDGSVQQVTYDGYDWVAREKYVVIVTDGDIYDWHDGARERIEQEIEDRGIIPILVNIDPGATDAGDASDVPWSFACPLEKLAEIVLGTVLGVKC